jgi:hypothetical protein
VEAIMAKYAKILGTGVFPLDMLRYDKAYPLSEKDAVAISSTFFNKCDNYEVNIGTSLAKFTVDRWRSFGVTIISNKKDT